MNAVEITISENVGVLRRTWMCAIVAPHNMWLKEYGKGVPIGFSRIVPLGVGRRVLSVPQDSSQRAIRPLLGRDYE